MCSYLIMYDLCSLLLILIIQKSEPTVITKYTSSFASRLTIFPCDFPRDVPLAYTTPGSTNSATGKLIAILMLYYNNNNIYCGSFLSPIL